MKQRSFFFRLFTGNLLLMGAMLAVSFVVAYVHINAEYRLSDRQSQGDILTALQKSFEGHWPESSEQTDLRCKELGEKLPGRVTVIADDGRVLGDSDAAPADMANHKTKSRPEVLDALAGRPGRHVRISDTLLVEFRYMAAPLRHEGRIVGTVRLAKPVKAIAEDRNFISRALLGSALAAVAVAGGLAMLISWLWSRPLREITDTAERIAAGDLTATAAIAGSRELAQLAWSLNEMRTNLAGKIDTIADQRENLQTVMANLGEGVVALDAERNIVLFNQAASDLLGLDPHKDVGKHFQTVVREPAIIDLLDSVSDDTAAAGQLQVRCGRLRRTVNAHAARVAAIRQDAIRILLVLRDITDIDRMATMKAEFVANASHELRTPLATIRVALDSMAMMDREIDPETFTRHLEILDRHVGRLESMTRDLLDLHMVEQTRGPLQTEIFPAAELTQWIGGHFAARARKREISLTTDTGDIAENLRCDRRLLQLILRNLIENAIKFTPAGGEVTCRLQQVGGRIVVTVADTGCGIPAELHNRVFERFFQADASRDGAAADRGTGLGLAIVKYAAERLKAGVELDSRVGEGTTFTVVIPVADEDDDARPAGD